MPITYTCTSLITSLYFMTSSIDIHVIILSLIAIGSFQQNNNFVRLYAKMAYVHK